MGASGTTHRPLPPEGSPRVCGGEESRLLSVCGKRSGLSSEPAFKQLEMGSGVQSRRLLQRCRECQNRRKDPRPRGEGRGRFKRTEVPGSCSFVGLLVKEPGTRGPMRSLWARLRPPWLWCEDHRPERGGGGVDNDVATDDARARPAGVRVTQTDGRSMVTVLRLVSFVESCS